MADAVWDAAEVERAPYRIVDLADDAALDAATAELGTELGAVWSGDARDGFNGGGNFVRWLRDDRDRAAAAAFFRAALRPGAGAAVPGGRAVLDPRVRAARRYGGAAAGRDRDAARPGGADDDLLRAGQHLGPAGGGPRGDARRRASRGCAPAARPRLPRRVRHRRGAHRRRVPAHRAQHPDVGRRHGAERGGPAVLHVPAGGARGRHRHRGSPRRTSRRWCRRWTPPASARSSPSASGGRQVPEETTRSPGTDGRSRGPTRRPGTCSRSASAASGLFARVEPCTAVVPGQRLAPVNAALLRLLDASYGTSFGPMEPAPDVRTVT